MFKKLKTAYWLLGLAFIFASGCSKNNRDTIYTTTATIVQVKYACGYVCDAMGFVIKTNGNELFTPIGLNPEFRIENLSIKIRFKNTGELPKPFTAPGYELGGILEISR
jgi:hypothetical protein